MDFIEAVKAMKEGKKVKRGDTDIWYLSSGTIRCEQNQEVPLIFKDYIATDWQIVEVVENKITFERVSNTLFNVLLDGKKVGDIWSKLTDGVTPHTGAGNIQICGFHKPSEVWGCSRYNKSKDMCLDFKP